MIPIEKVKGVGPKLAQHLKKLNITCQEDLLFHLPLRYQDRTRLTPLADLIPGSEVLIEGEIISNQIRFGRRRYLLITLEDHDTRINIRLFHFHSSQQKSLQPGKRLRCFGSVNAFNHSLEMVHPEYSFISSEQVTPMENTLTPVYPTTEGITQKRLQKLISTAANELIKTEQLPELLPEEIIIRDHLPSLKQSLSIIHNPTPDISPQQLLAFAHPAQRRLVYEEIIAHQLVMRQLRNEYQQRIAPPLTQGHIARELFIQQLPFTLTDAQQRVAAEVVKDLQCDHPMQRLIQGDVGSGKTVIAALAAIEAAASGLQTAIMAPTELLAEQHYKNLRAWFDKLNIQTCWLSGSMTGGERKERSRLIENGEAQVIIGTHALFQKSVIFNYLGLVIIDEQHRFGVHQRLALKQKGEQDQFHPHQLIMTATPIPRTLAMTLYADLDLSVIDQLPAGRLPVKTVVINEDRRDEVLERVKLACSDGSQVYWVCPLVEESELLQCQAAEQSFLSISELLPDIKVGLIHGRLKQSEKEKIMGDFKQGEIDLLVATTVIEVGVDVPNASLMVIENSERLGLAQLHQLRGRVGRGTRQSNCVLLYKPPLSDNARDRLAVMRESNDGFVIAQKDLEIRGSGELLGTRQTGIERFRVADLIRDSRLINQATDDADHILLHFPHLIDPLINRWLRTEKQLVSV